MADAAVRLLGAPGGGEEVREAWADPLLAPLCRPLVRLGATPGQLTALSLLASAAAALLLASGGDLGPAMALVIISWALDGLDGSLARLTRTASRLGALVDRLADRLAVFLLLLALVLSGRVGGAPALSALFLFMLVDYVRLRLKLDWGLDAVEATGGRALVAAGWLLGDFSLALWAGSALYLAMLAHQALALRRAGP